VEEESVWIFSGAKGRFPGGVFSSLDLAERWIRKNKLTGVLTKYPLDIGSFDWAKANGMVSDIAGRKPEEEDQFIGSFSSASFDHFHYEQGEIQ
jgi:hypothetical protein